MDRQPRKAEEVYSELLKEIPNKRTYVWSYGNFVFLFVLKFRTLVTIIDTVLKIGTDNVYKLGEWLSSSVDDQEELVKELREMPTGDGKAYEELVKKILEYLFNYEFNPFKVKDQVGTYNKKRIRDFIIDNRNPRIEFWRDLKSVRRVEKILLDAKNYKDPVEYSEITSTLRYLKNRAFGNFIIIISRYGVKDYVETIEDYSEDGRVILHLSAAFVKYSNKTGRLLEAVYAFFSTIFVTSGFNERSISDEDLIAMIILKREGESPTLLIEEKYYDFLDKK